MYQRSLKPLNLHHFFLFGARGTGKTTLINKLFMQANTLRVDLLDLELEQKYALAPKILIEEIEADQELKYVVIDEIQKLPKLLDLIHSYIQKNKTRVIFILTGSSAKKLKQSGANLLAGRAFVYNLFPLTYEELGEDFKLQTYLELGGLPEVYSFKDSRYAKKFLKTYALTYLKEEVWAEHLIKKLEPFRRFLELAATANGEIINYTKLSRQVGVSNKTVQAYIQLLEETLVVFLLEPYSTSIRKRLIKSPKLYFFDPGVKRALDNSLEIPLKAGTYAYGKSFEHFVITQIIFKINYAENDFQVSFLKTEAGVEVDLVLEKPNKEIILIEIKSSQYIDQRDVKNISELSKEMKKSHAILLSLQQQRRVINNVQCFEWSDGIDYIFNQS